MKQDVNSKLPMYYGATPLLFARAKILRQNSTDSENVLWEYISKNQLGVKFRRQHPIYKFIADFYCHSHKLVIELDGEIHNTEEAKEKDAIRTYIINELGIKVIRFKNHEIQNNTNNVVQKIKSEIEKQKKSL